MTRTALAVAALCLALAGCGDGGNTNPQSNAASKAAAAHDGDLRFEADIIVGRVEVMQDHTHRGLELLTGSQIAVEPPETLRDTYRRLYSAVVRYNTLNKSACAAGVAGGNLCGGAPYLPLWYAGRARPDTSGQGLKVMAEEMQGQMTPLWDAVCMKTKAKTGDKNFCAIE